MKAHKITLLVLNFEDTKESELKYLIEDNKYLSVSIKNIETVDIGEWEDSHPLNRHGTDWTQFFPNGGDQK